MTDNDHLLNILQAHGQQFLSSFSLPTNSQHKYTPSSESVENEYEEWSGIDEAMASDIDDINEDDGFTADSRTGQPKVSVFVDTVTSSSGPRQATATAFMSSKVSKLRQDSLPQQLHAHPKGGEDEELISLQNDALLHRLVHTKLLSGSLNPDLDLTRPQRRKALAGRVLELAGEQKLGKGESAVRLSERNKAAKHVRDGLARKQQARDQAQLEEAKQLGNYHPALKKLFKGSSNSRPRPRKREKGLAMGVGRFSGGVLKLSREDVKSVQRGAGPGRKLGRPGKH